MKCGLVLLVVVCTAASVAEDFIKSTPPAPAIAEFQFSTPQVGTEELANTIEQKKSTTKRRPTTKAKPTTTTEKPTTTTTAKPTTTTEKPTTTTEKPTTTTTAKPTTTTAKPTTTTAKPTTTTAKPTTTTEKPTTTTAKPTTTTAKPTTTTAKPTTTTAKPTTTTGKPTTTTGKPTTTAKPAPPKPTPPAQLIMGKYNVTDKNRKTCLLAHMALQIRLVSAKVNGTFIIQPNITEAHGSCQEKTSSLNLTFTEGFITFNYNKNTTGNSVYVTELSFKLSYTFNTTEATYTADNKSLHLFPARVGQSYSCRSESVNIGNGLFLDVTQAQMQAFNFTENNVFDVACPCPADIPTYGVAIAVGVILLVLIIIVVVAYVVGRRRRANGYQAL